MLISQSSLRADQLSSNDQRIAGIRKVMHVRHLNLLHLPPPAPVRYLFILYLTKRREIKVALHNFTRSLRVTRDRRELSVTLY